MFVFSLRLQCCDVSPISDKCRFYFVENYNPISINQMGNVCAVLMKNYRNRSRHTYLSKAPSISFLDPVWSNTNHSIHIPFSLTKHKKNKE
jgi:hypothetical protein